MEGKTINSVFYMTRMLSVTTRISDRSCRQCSCMSFCLSPLDVIWEFSFLFHVDFNLFFLLYFFLFLSKDLVCCLVGFLFDLVILSCFFTPSLTSSCFFPFFTCLFLCYLLFFIHSLLTQV